MAFNPDEYLNAKQAPAQGGFNPDTYLAKASQADSSKSDPSLLSRIESGAVGNRVRSFLDNPSGFMDQLKQESGDAGAAQDDSTYQKQVADYDEKHNIHGVMDRVTDSGRLKRILGISSDFPKQNLVAGTPPMALPATAVPKIAALATKIAEGQGLGYSAARTGLATAQGAISGASDGQEGDTIQDKANKALHGAKLSGAIQLGLESLPYVGKLAGYASKKLGSAISGVPEELIDNYAKRTNEVNQVINESGGDITTAADQVRTELSNGIQKTKRALNSQISSALENAPKEATLSIDPIVEKLEVAKSKLNPNFKSSAISEIDDMIASIKKEAEDGRVNPKSLYEIKQFLNEGSSSAYNKGGQIFTRAKESARAARDAAGAAREILAPVSEDVASADAQLSRLHQIESRLNRNLLAPGKPDGALMAAGAGANVRNAATLQELEDMSGVPVMQKAKDLATAREFANPKLLAKDATGKAVARMMVGAGAGYALDGEKGAYVGGALASPMAVKLGINAANVAKGLGAATKIPQVAQFMRQNPVISQMAVQKTDQQLRRANPELFDKPDEPSGNQLGSDGPGAERSPARGIEKWAMDGANRLGLSPDEAQKIMETKEGKRILIEASDLPAGSKRLQQIKDRLQRGRR